MKIGTNTETGKNCHGLDIDRLRNTLLEAADAAARITLPAFRSPLLVDNKEQENFDPVTEADRKAELAIRQIIEANFPDHAIIGEEFADKHTDSPFSWIIDPIDGTRSFISGLPVWGTLISLSHMGVNFAGIMAQPFLGETFLGLPGQTLYQRGTTRQVLKTSPVTELSHAIMFTTTPALFEGRSRANYDQLEKLVRLPRYGCDCYAYCLLAAGHVDLVVESSLKIYDIAALIPVVRNAGGVITDCKGDAPDRGGCIIAAATPELHAAALAQMRK